MPARLRAHFGGQILVADDLRGKVHAIKHNLRLHRYSKCLRLDLPDWAAESIHVIPSESCPPARAAPTSRRYSTLTRSSHFR